MTAIQLISVIDGMKAFVISLSQVNIISKKIKYIELSALKDFNDFYIDCMMFE